MMNNLGGCYFLDEKFLKGEMIKNINIVLKLLQELYKKRIISHGTLRENAMLKLAFLKANINTLEKANEREETEQILREYMTILK